MGYMGFGMRKDVYKRKPKKSFERIKKFRKQVPHKAGKLNVSKEYQKIRFRSLRDKGWFKYLILGLLVLLVVVYLVLEIIVFPYIDEKREKEFFDTGALEFYEESGISTVLPFVQSRYERLDRISNTINGQGLELWLRSEDYKPGFFGKVYIGVEESEKARFELNKLIIEEGENIQVLDSNWRVRLQVRNIRDLDPSLFEYLDSSPTELDVVLRIVSKYNLSFVTTEEGGFVNFYRGRSYAFGYFFNQDSTTRTRIYKEIKPGIFLTEWFY